MRDLRDARFGVFRRSSPGPLPVLREEVTAVPIPKASEAQVQPGDLVALDAKLRTFMGDFDDHALLIEPSFLAYGSEVEAAAAAARPVVQEAANMLCALLALIEKTAEYKQQRARPRSASTHNGNGER